MDILYLLIPLAVVLAVVIGTAFWMAVDGGQFDDLEAPALRILADDDRPAALKEGAREIPRAFDLEQQAGAAGRTDSQSRQTQSGGCMRITLFIVAVLILGGALLADAAGELAGERSGQQIVKGQCAGCHEKGLHGAPRIDDRAAWIPRLKNGLDATVRSAIKGHGAMPSRGGLSDLTDTELRSAVVYLFNSSGPPPKAPQPPPLAANQKIVDGVEVFLGLKRVKDGVQHLTITLRDANTHAAIGDAQVEVSVTNPVMGTDTRKLDRVSVGKAVSYGNDFRVSGREPHVITVRVRRPGNPKLIETKFDFKG